MMNEDFLSKSQEIFQRAADDSSRETNIIFRELVKQLILVATVILTVSGFAFNMQTVISKIDVIDKILLIISWLFAVLSIIFGIIQIIVDYFFFRNNTRLYQSILDKIGKECPGQETLKSFVEGVHRSHKVESSTLPVWTQIILVAGSIIIIFFIMSKFLLRIGS